MLYFFIGINPLRGKGIKGLFVRLPERLEKDAAGIPEHPPLLFKWKQS